ncbi:hypothetical protein A3197_17530 [Candidatus Thiodiazotropha endoloripes]|nr:hypothetical protein A3197_17530 [Candidatus Thiodiazotropha endoloripes]
MTRVDVIKKIGRIGAYVMLFTSALILIFWRVIERAIPAGYGPELLIGIIVAGFTVVAIDIYSQLGRTHTKEVALLSHKSIKDCIASAVSEKKRFESLRVFASTSEIILPAIRESGIHVNKCYLMLQELDGENGNIKAISMNRKVDGFVESWKGLSSPEQGIIGKIFIKRYKFVPNHYFVIFGDNCLVQGLYYETTVDGHSVDFLEPILVESKTASGQQLIRKYQSLFDTIYENE